MIYKNFYNKYKMSEQIKLNIDENKNENENEDIDKINPVSLEDNQEPTVINEDKVIKAVDNEKKEDELAIKEDNVQEEQEKEQEEQEEQEKKEKKDEIFLSLGDLIYITDPKNEILNNNTFIIEYIDNKKIKLINTTTFEKTILHISSSGVIGDGTIKSIKVLSSAKEKGYARQNDLLPSTWVDIYFEGETPAIITGEITNIEEDMIEIRTIDNDTIFINFAYKGIPEDLPIKMFEIRPAIKDQNEIEMKEMEDNDNLEDLENIEQGVEAIDKKEQITLKKREPVKDQRMLFDLSDLEFGEAIKVEEYINVDRDKYRYNIESQTNDLLEELISKVPNMDRTNNVLNNIHIMITRFLQLRQISSTFDSNKIVTGKITKTANDKPLAEYLSGFKNQLYWIMMVAKNIKKIYQTKAIEGVSYDDCEILDEKSSLKELSDLFVNQKYSKELKNRGDSKYHNFTSKSFDKYMTPFYSLNPDTINDVYTKPNGIIIEGNVETEINAIVDNLDDLYSTVVDVSKIKNRRFVIQRYNLGLDKLEASNFKGSHMIARRVKLTENDQISINSIVTLPEPTVQFSQINLPGSNLLVKSNLNMNFLNYWQLLKQKTDITRISIDGLDNELEYDDNNFVDNIKQYYLDLTGYNRREDLTNLDIYKIFLRTIVPKIRILFGLVKKYIKGRLSMVEVINYLEPFLIYPDDLTYQQYVDINKFIEDKIKEYNKQFKESSIHFSSLKTIKTRSSFKKETQRYVYSNPLFNLISNDTNMDSISLQNQVLEDYGIKDVNSIHDSGSEFLKRVTTADYGNLYNTAVALSNIGLMYPTDLSSVFNTDKDKLKVIMEKDAENNTCKSYIIAKKYYSLEALEEDNNKTIYFDKEYDTTNYDLIDDKYKKERDNLSNEELIDFLTNELRKKEKLSEPDAEYIAINLVNRIKKIREGNYAILLRTSETNQPEMLEYYVRNNDIWVLDNDVDPNLFIKDDDVLCNMNFNCIYNSTEKNEDKCGSTELSKDTIVNNALKQILDQFDKNYNISKDDLNGSIRKQLAYFTNIFDRIQNLKRIQFYKYTEQQYNLGLSVMEEMKGKVVSPYIKLRDLIMGQNDFMKKQQDILNFVRLYCREGNPEIPNIHDGEMENEWWLYCVKTDTKLLPKFVYILADTFTTNNSEYENVLNELKRKIGKRSDNGDTWVDEHSGEVICYIDYDVSEGYSGGFVDKSRDIMEKDVSETIIESQQEKKEKKDKGPKLLSPEGTLVSNVISVLSSNMGIDIENSRNFIIKVVTDLINDTRILVKEPEYKKKEVAAAKTGKKIASYASVYSQTLMYLTLGTYLIAIQTNIPSIKTRKTAPGCVRSFSGYPFEGEGDDSGLQYVVCVALKSRDPHTIPWNSLSKDETKVIGILKKFIVNYLIPYTEIDQKMKEKSAYLLLNKEEDIPEEYNLVNWTNFLPPLQRFNIKKLDNVSNAFKTELHDELISGNYRQEDKLLVLDSKIISFSLAIQEAIQKIVEKKDLLMKASNKMFIDNACCNETSNKVLTTLQYFVNENSNIEMYNNVIFDLSELISNVKLLTNGKIMLSEINTKRIFPILSNEFSVETIYYGFIILGKFQSSVPLTDEIESICKGKPDYLKKVDTIEEKIEKLKRDGRNYTKEEFLRLFQLVSKNNIIKLSLSSNMSNMTEIKKLLVKENMTNELLENILDEYELTSKKSIKTLIEKDNKLSNEIKYKLQKLLETTDDSCINGLKNVLELLDRENNENVPKVLVQQLGKMVDLYDKTLEENTDEMKALKNHLSKTNDTMRNDIIDFIKIKVNRLELQNITIFLKELTEWRFNEETELRNMDTKISDDGMYNYINYMKNAIELMAVVFPTMIINRQIQTIKPPKYWKLSKNHEYDIVEMVNTFYNSIEGFYGDDTIKNVLNEILNKSRGIYLLSKTTPALTNIKIGDKELHSVFDKRTSVLLYEYYFLSVLTDYIVLTKDPSMVTRMLLVPDNDDSNVLMTDFLVAQELRMEDQEQAFIQGNVMTLKQDVSKLIVTYMNIMIQIKKTLNMSYNDIQDKVFRSKEAEKYDFTDRLKDVTDEQRNVDKILKKNKLGPLYSIGLSKGIREYDPENFEHDKIVAEEIAKYLNANPEGDVEDMIEERNIQREIDEDNALNVNNTDDYDDGDPWGDELENNDDYN